MLVSAAQLSESSIYVYTYIPSPVDLPPIPDPICLVIREHQAEIPVFYSQFPLSILHMIVYE